MPGLKRLANEFLRLGRTLKKAFREQGHEEPAEYFFVWERAGEPVRPSADPNKWGRDT